MLVESVISFFGVSRGVFSVDLVSNLIFFVDSMGVLLKNMKLLISFEIFNISNFLIVKLIFPLFSPKIEIVIFCSISFLVFSIFFY